jgi:hypothetical protein
MAKLKLSQSVIFHNATMLTILSKSIAIIVSDTAEKSIADSDSYTSKVSPIVSLSIATIDINNPTWIEPITDRAKWRIARSWTQKQITDIALLPQSVWL